MKLAYIRDINQCDQLAKLGRKVVAPKPESPEAIRLREVEAFERGVFNAVKAAAESVGRDTFLKAMSSQHGATWIGIDLATKPDQTVSFADVGEMGGIEATSERVNDAYIDAVTRVGAARADCVWHVIAARFDCIGRLSFTPKAWPAAIAALEALR